jgi:hypothetical protein
MAGFLKYSEPRPEGSVTILQGIADRGITLFRSWLGFSCVGYPVSWREKAQPSLAWRKLFKSSSFTPGSPGATLFSLPAFIQASS